MSNWFDRLVGVFAPTIALRNAKAREATAHIDAKTMHESMAQRFGTNSGPYEAGNQNRMNRHSATTVTENEAPRENIGNMRARAWGQFRNNPQARKVVRTLQAKVIGDNLHPQSQASLPDGSPHRAFRTAVTNLWTCVSTEFDYRGMPGRGGQTLCGMEGTALAALINSGGFLYRFRHLDRRTQRSLGLTIPLQLQLIHRSRLDESKHDAETFYGTKLNSDDSVAGYWIRRFHPGDPRAAAGNQSEYVPANIPMSRRCQIAHCFLPDDIDQLDGTPWGCASMPRATLRNDYEIAEVSGAEAAACIVMGYRRSTGHTQFGLGNPDLTNERAKDGYGNPITNIQHRMFVDLGTNGDLVMPNKPGPNPNATEFIGHMIGSEAVGFPGVKRSTLTADYRRSSFSSERSADNDVWPELRRVQEFFFNQFMQVLYVEILLTAFESGYFDRTVEGFQSADFVLRNKQYTMAKWQGPVQLSINPKDDEEASQMRVQNGRSNPYREAAAAGSNLSDNLDHVVDFIEECEMRGVPEWYRDRLLGRDIPAAPASEPMNDGADASGDDGEDPAPVPARRLTEQEADALFHGVLD